MLVNKNEYTVDTEGLYLINANDEYVLNQTVNEAMLEMDEENLHNFLFFCLTFFLGWIFSGVFQ